MKKIIVSVSMIVGMSILPALAQGDIVSLQPLSGETTTTTTSSSVAASPLGCFDLTRTLKAGSTGYEVRGLQFDLIKEGSSIPVSEYGTFGDATVMAVNTFQTKYASEILTNGSAPTGLVGKKSRTKLNSMYGCNVATSVAVTSPTTPAIPASVILNIKNVAIDGSGVTVVVCNQSPTDIPAFPFRVRLNGIIRDFNDPSALKAGICDSDTIPFSVWGLTYDTGVTYGVVTAIDPNGMYKTAKISYPLTATTTLTVPAIAGAHMSVRGISIKSNGIQATLCNLGTSDLANYPVRVTVNGTSRDVDATGVHTHGQCQAVTWTYDLFTIAPGVGSIINATVNIDPNNTIQESNEFDNSATIVGSI